MNKIEFLERLEKLLSDIPYTERREALNYYTEYFEDADKDESEVIKMLGSPEEVAHNIREELAGKELGERLTPEENGNVYGESGNAQYENNAADSGSQYQNINHEQRKKKLEGWEIALIVIAAIVTLPVWGGVLSAAVSAVLGLIAGFFGIIIGLAAVSVACLVGAIALFVAAIVKIIISPLASVFLLGTAVFLLGISMLCLVACWKSVTVLIPAIWRGIVRLYHSVFHKKEGVTV